MHGKNNLLNAVKPYLGTRSGYLMIQLFCSQAQAYEKDRAAASSIDWNSPPWSSDGLGQLQEEAMKKDTAAGLPAVDMLHRTVTALGMCRKPCFAQMYDLDGEKKKLVVFRCVMMRRSQQLSLRPFDESSIMPQAFGVAMIVANVRSLSQPHNSCHTVCASFNTAAPTP